MVRPKVIVQYFSKNVDSTIMIRDVLENVRLTSFSINLYDNKGVYYRISLCASKLPSDRAFQIISKCIFTFKLSQAHDIPWVSDLQKVFDHFGLFAAIFNITLRPISMCCVRG